MAERYFKRISVSSLSKHVGEPITLLGEFHQLEANGRIFSMKTSATLSVTVHLQEPVQDILEGIVEVRGILSNNNTLQCEKIINFPRQMTENFDLALFNETMMLVEHLPNHYAVSA